MKTSFKISVGAALTAVVLFIFCGGEGTPDYCSDGNPVNLHNEFCGNDGRAYPKCQGGQTYDPTEKFCDDDKLWSRCNGKRYLTSLQFCAPGDVLLFKCMGKEFDPAVEGCIHNQVLWPKCGRNFFDEEIEFCHDNRMVFRRCFNNPNFDYSAFNPQTGCDGDPTLPTCDGQPYDPTILFCFYNEDRLEFDTRELCGGVDFDANTHECVDGVIVSKDPIEDLTFYCPLTCNAQTGASILEHCFETEAECRASVITYWCTSSNCGSQMSGSSLPNGCFTSRDICLAEIDNGNNGGSQIVGDTLIDERDDQRYRIVEIGTQTWMAENLSFNATGSWCNGTVDDNCSGYGRHYDWATALSLPSSCYTNSCEDQIQTLHRGICPAGWHLPNMAEWDVLINFVGGEETAGTKLKSSTDWDGIDEFGFSALPGDIPQNDNFFNVGINGWWWSATEFNETEARGLSMGLRREHVSRGRGPKSGGMSVRCVRSN